MRPVDRPAAQDESTAAELPRREALLRAASCALMAGLPVSALGQAAAPYPNQPIKWVVALPAGGGVDSMTRLVAGEMAPRLGQALVIENRVGAGGTIGAASVARAAPDGYTIMTIDMLNYTAVQHLYSKLPYHPAKDLQIIGTMTQTPFILAVRADHPARNFQEFVALARQNPGKVTYGSAGIGSPHHIGAELLQRRLGIQLMHIPYKAQVAIITDLIGGQVELAFGDQGTLRGFIQKGQIRALAAATEKRLDLLPDVPTLAELGVKDVVLAVWLGLAVPRGVPPAVTERLSAALKDAMETPAVREKVLTAGGLPFYKGGAEAATFVNAQVNFWGDVVQAMNIKLD
jgi:tripartite-type tricarboxylate transporter receptor subunit TctC